MLDPTRVTEKYLEACEREKVGRRRIKERCSPDGGDRSADHVRRCLELVADLDRHYPPQSPVHGLYQSFLHEPSSVAAYKDRVLAIVALLKPNQRLLHKFYGLLPAWVFR